MEPLFNYGDRVKDSITSYSGYVTAMCDFFGKRENEYCVESLDKEGSPKAIWIIGSRLIKIERG